MIHNELLNSQLISSIFDGEVEWIDSGFLNGAENMRFDEERARNLVLGFAGPMLRVYGWKPWAVSLGANQKDSDINHVECEKRGFDIVRRATGGRAVLHADELTYSVVLRIPEGISVHDIYRMTHERILAGLRTITPEIEFEKSQPNFSQVYKAQPQQTVACFASSARYEIMHDGRKVVGSAQRVFGNVLLQHGSILLGAGHEQLADISALRNGVQADSLREYILSHSATLSEIVGRKVEFQEVAEAIRCGFLGLD
ncbi:MAG: lipoate--protein ligase family protein [Ignavibacteria bacterium]|nr:lipoate--protein ligase family protein [Ignavibacteria bacterium]